MARWVAAEIRMLCTIYLLIPHTLPPPPCPLELAPGSRHGEAGSGLHPFWLFAEGLAGACPAEHPPFHLGEELAELDLAGRLVSVFYWAARKPQAPSTAELLGSLRRQ